MNFTPHIFQYTKKNYVTEQQKKNQHVRNNSYRKLYKLELNTLNLNGYVEELSHLEFEKLDKKLYWQEKSFKTEKKCDLR